MSQEKRRFSRFPFEVRAQLSIEGKQIGAGSVVNLSTGGCLLKIDADLEAATPCEVVIRLAGATEDLAVRVQGTITRSVDGRTAVDFSAIDPDSLGHLLKIVRYNATDIKAEPPQRVPRVFS